MFKFEETIIHLFTHHLLTLISFQTIFQIILNERWEISVPQLKTLMLQKVNKDKRDFYSHINIDQWTYMKITEYGKWELKWCNSQETSLVLSALHIPWKTGGKTLVLCFSFQFYLDSQKTFNSFQQFGKVFRDRKVHILRSFYVTSSTYFSAPGRFVQELVADLCRKSSLGGVVIRRFTTPRSVSHCHSPSCLLSNLKMNFLLCFSNFFHNRFI